jgi:hypothetical protein
METRFMPLNAANTCLTTLALAALVAGVCVDASAANLLKNGSFESPVEHSPREATHWTFNQPDTHGDHFGSAAREGWRAHDGLYIMTVQGTWADRGDYGGIWQEAEAQPGEIYRASGWFWADEEWQPAAQELKLEFYSADYAELLHTESVALGSLEPRWQRVEVSATAPENARWIRLVIFATGVSDAGALQVDSLYLATNGTFDEPAPNPVDIRIEILDEE